MNHGPYIKLIAGFLFTSLAFMVSWGQGAALGVAVGTIPGAGSVWWVSQSCLGQEEEDVALCPQSMAQWLLSSRSCTGCPP